MITGLIVYIAIVSIIIMIALLSIRKSIDDLTEEIKKMNDKKEDEK